MLASPFVWSVTLVEWRGGGMCCGVPSSDRDLHLVLSCSSLCCPAPPCVVPSLHCVCCYSIVGLVVCFVAGLCYCGMAVGFMCGLEWRWVCSSRRLSSTFSSFSFSSVVGVRGSARAALRARTLSPNTIVFLCLLLFSLPSPPVFLVIAE